jgi:mono/diheme cytochrome c family protein
MPRITHGDELANLPAGFAPLARGRCLACHKLGDQDGRVSPDLTFIGGMRTRKYIRQFMNNPERLVPGAMMPRTVLEPPEAERLARRLAGRSAASAPEGPRRQYMALCQRCHAANGDGHGIIQPNLARFPRAFAGNKDFYRSVSDSRMLESLAKGVPGTSMPPYGGILDPQDRDRLLDLVFQSFVRLSRQDKDPGKPVPGRPERLPGASRADRLYQARCARCHGRAGTGTGPEYLRYLPQPRNLTNTPFFESIRDERIARAIADGVPGSAMPGFRDEMDAGQIWGLVRKVRAFSREGG